MKKRVLLIVAQGTEEMEAVITIDVLRRAGIEVLVAGLEGGEPVVCSRGVRLVPDCALREAQGPFDLIALPGGAEGARSMAASPQVQALLRTQAGEGRYVAALCAAPLALVSSGVGQGSRLTSHPAVADQIAPHGRYSQERVVVDGRLVTSRGPGTTFEFALKLVELLEGSERARTVAAPMLLPAGG